MKIRKAPRKDEDDVTPRECVPITVDQLALALKVGHAAANGRMPRQSFESKYEEARARGKVPAGAHYRMTDKPLNHALVAIAGAFPERRDSPEGYRLYEAAVDRSIWLYDAAVKDARAQRFIFTKDGRRLMGQPLFEAIAITPRMLGDETLDSVFAKADELAVGWDPNNDPPVD